MYIFPSSVQKLIDEFAKLPGVGPKTAARMAYFYLRAPKKEAEKLSSALLELKDKVRLCERCYNLSEEALCPICSDSNRDHNTICIVEESLDIFAFEKTASFSGVYFVLGGLISPIDGIGPNEIRISELLELLKETVKSLESSSNSTSDLDDLDGAEMEIVLALNPTLEGEATTSYIVNLVKKELTDDLERIKFSRLARGLPTGADLKYADYSTLRRAFEGRTGVS